MIEKINLFNRLIKKSFLGREKRWNEFREFHKNIVDTIDPKLAEKIGSVSNVCKKNESYALEFNAKDYAWWGTYNHENCDIITVTELEIKVTNKLRKLKE